MEEAKKPPSMHPIQFDSNCDIMLEATLLDWSWNIKVSDWIGFDFVLLQNHSFLCLRTVLWLEFVRVLGPGIFLPVSFWRNVKMWLCTFAHWEICRQNLQQKKQRSGYGSSQFLRLFLLTRVWICLNCVFGTLTFGMFWLHSPIPILASM